MECRLWPGIHVSLKKLVCIKYSGNLFKAGCGALPNIVEIGKEKK